MNYELERSALAVDLHYQGIPAVERPSGLCVGDEELVGCICHFLVARLGTAARFLNHSQIAAVAPGTVPLPELDAESAAGSRYLLGFLDGTVKVDCLHHFLSLLSRLPIMNKNIQNEIHATALRAALWSSVLTGFASVVSDRAVDSDCC